MRNFKIQGWHREFIRSLFHYSIERRDIRRGLVAKDPYVPRYLYKYRTFCEKHLDALHNGVLWMSSAKRLNDHYDGAFKIDPGRYPVCGKLRRDLVRKVKKGPVAPRSRKKLLNLLTKKCLTQAEWYDRCLDVLAASKDPRTAKRFKADRKQSIYESRAKATDEFVQQLRSYLSILSLSETCTSPQMWAYYADTNCGFAIEYDFSTIDDTDWRKQLCMPVFYTYKLRDMTRHMRNGPPFGQANSVNGLFPTYAALMKQADWRHEQEWRIVCQNDAEKANRAIEMPQPSSIILGLDVTNKNQSKMLSFCKDRGLKLKKIQRPSSKYGLSIVAIE